MATFFKIISGLSSVVVTLCLVALLPWMMGIPGQNNNQYKGWSMGLYALLLYPVAHLLLFLSFFVGRDRVSLPARDQWQSATSVAASLAIVALGARMVQAFRTMMSP